jgi:protocatechuate 3,4-dioxygenase beta subunit
VTHRNLLLLGGAILAAVVAWIFLRQPDPAPAASEPGHLPSAAAPDVAGPSGRRASTAPSHTVSVTGRVTAADAGVADAWVVLRRHDAPTTGDRQRTVRTESDGSFAFDDVDAGRYAVSATAEGFLPGVLRRLDLADGDPAPVVLRLEPGGQRVHGSIEDVMGGPIDGALVRVVPLSGFAALRQHEGFGTVGDEDGHYELRAAPGRYRIEVEHPDYAGDSRGIEIGKTDSQQDFRLVPTASIEGIVRDGDGGPALARAHVRWMRERAILLPDGESHVAVAGGGAVVTDEEGRFRITGLPPGVVQLTATAPARATSEGLAVAVAIAENVQDVELIVGEAFDVRGRVVDAKSPDAGIANAKVRLGAGGPDGLATETDAEGNFELFGVLAGDYMLDATADGYGLSLPGTPAHVEGDVEGLVLALDAGLEIRGRVEPPQLAQVRLDFKPEQMRMGTALMVSSAAGGVETEADGTFVIGPVSPGDITVIATAADGTAGETSVTVAAEGADGVVVKLQPRATVRGHVRGADGVPVAQAQVTLRRPQPDGRIMRLTVNGRDMGTLGAITDDDGAFEIVGVAADRYEITVSDRYGDELALLGGPLLRDGPVPEIEIGSADRSDVDLSVDAHDGIVRGTVTTADGDPAADVWVTLARRPDPIAPRPDDGDEEGESRSESRMIIATSDGTGSGGRPPALTGEDGSFQFTGLRDGSYQITAEADGGRSRTTDQARPGEHVKLRLGPLSGVEGRAMLDGEPLQSFVVAVAGPTSRSRRVRDKRGHFAVDRLDPGEYRLTVRAGGASGSADFEVKAGQTATQDIILEQPAKVRGTLVDDAGKPIEGAMILVGEGSAEQGRIAIEQDGSEAAITTDAEGKFDFTCAAGGRVLVAIEPGTPEPVAVEFFAAKAGDDIDLGQLDPSDRPPRRGGPAKVEEDTVIEP